MSVTPSSGTISNIPRAAPQEALRRFACLAYAAMDAGPAFVEWADVFARAGASVVALGRRTGDECRADICVLIPTDAGMPGRTQQRASECFNAAGSRPCMSVDARIRSGEHWVGVQASAPECWGTIPIRLSSDLNAVSYALCVSAADAAALKSVMILAEELHDPLAVVLEAVDRMRDLATHDAMTGLLNRRGVEEQLPRVWNHCQRAGQAVSVLMMDLDSLKAINDTHGHAAGDQAILRIAGILKSSLRAQDLAARWGGDEMCVVLPGTTVEEARRVSDRLLRRIEACRLEPPRGHVGFSVSMGLSGVVPPRGGDSPQRLLVESDDALREAKRGGGNQVRVHVAPSSSMRG